MRPSLKIIVIGLALVLVGACTQNGATPSVKIGPVVVKPVGLSLPTAQIAVTESVTPQASRPTALPPVNIVPQPMPATATSAATSATSVPFPPQVSAVLYQITLVQHHHNPETRHDYFTCASRGQGLGGVEIDPNGPRFVGPNSMDFDLWGIVALFKVNPDGSIYLVPQQTGGRFVDPDGVEHQSFTLAEALSFFASGDAIWIGAHGEAGRIADCDPQFVTPTPTPDQ